jgi:hypothetical protein
MSPTHAMLIGCGDTMLIGTDERQKLLHFHLRGKRLLEEGTTVMIRLGNELAMIASSYHMETLQEAIIAHNHSNKWTGGKDLLLLPIHLK